MADLGNLLKNQYVSIPYFPALSTLDNALFWNTMQERYGVDYIVTDQAEASFAQLFDDNSSLGNFEWPRHRLQDCG